MRSLFAPVALLAALLLTSLAFASGGGETIGTIPGSGGPPAMSGAQTATGPGQGNSTGNVTSLTVKPGQNGTCNASCNNETGSHGKCVLNSNGDVTTYSGFVGSITNVKVDAVVTLGPASDTSVTGTGATVNLGSNSTTVVTNSGGSNMIVKFPGGQVVAVPSGSSAIFHS